MYVYDISATLNTDIGHIGASHLRHETASSIASSLLDGETLESELLSGREIRFRLSSPNEIRDTQATMLRESIKDFIESALDRAAGETVNISELEMTSYPGSAPSR